MVLNRILPTSSKDRVQILSESPLPAVLQSTSIFRPSTPEKSQALNEPHPTVQGNEQLMTKIDKLLDALNSKFISAQPALPAAEKCIQFELLMKTMQRKLESLHDVINGMKYRPTMSGPRTPGSRSDVVSHGQILTELRELKAFLGNPENEPNQEESEKKPIPTKKTNLDGKVENLRASLSQVQTSLQRIKKEKEKIETEQEESRAESLRLKESNSSLLAEIERMTNENSIEKKKAHSKESEIFALQSENTKLRLENREYHEKMQSLIVDFEGIQSKYYAAMRQNTQLRFELDMKGQTSSHSSQTRKKESIDEIPQTTDPGEHKSPESVNDAPFSTSMFESSESQLLLKKKRIELMNLQQARELRISELLKLPRRLTRIAQIKKKKRLEQTIENLEEHIRRITREIQNS